MTPGAAVPPVSSREVGPLLPDDPATVGEYRLLGRLEDDVRGPVFLAGSASGLPVTVRLLSPSWMADPLGRAAVLQSLVAARRADRLSCSARVIGAELNDPPAHLVTEYVEGLPLRDVVAQQGPLDASQTERLAVETLEALVALHEVDVAHRNLRPATVVVGPDGVRLVDVGLGVDVPGDPFGDDVQAWGAMIRQVSGAAALAPTLSEVVHACLTSDPAFRPTARQALDRLVPPRRTAPRVAPLSGSIPLPTVESTAFESTAFESRGADEPPASVPSGGIAVNGRQGAPDGTAAVGPRRRGRRGGTARRGGLAGLAGLPGRQGLPGLRGGDRRRGLLAALVAVLLLVTGGGVLALTLRDDTSSGSGQAAQDAPCPDHPGQAPLVATFTTDQEGCYGFTDSGPGFGRQQQILDLQGQIFAENAAVTSPDLTVVWLGALTCTNYRSDGACADGRIYEAERQELQGLLVAQKAAGPGHTLRVVLANAGPGMRHVERVAELLAARRDAFGRVVVIGGGESRQETRNAFGTLLAGGIPVIAPVLSSDLASPGRPFIDEPGFLQLSRPNQEFATSVVDFVARHTAAGTEREVIVFHEPDTGDEYTGSYALDVVALAETGQRTRVPAQPVVSSINKIPASVCRDAAGRATDPKDPPAALFFADRWASFKPFAEALTTLCGDAGPAMLITSDSVSRIMANDEMRAQIKAPYPMAYLRKGKQCSELEAVAASAPGGEAAKLLTAVRAHLGACAPGSGARQLGGRVPMFWDAVELAFLAVPVDQASPSGAPPSGTAPSGTTGAGAPPTLADVSLLGATGPLQVLGGKMAGYSDPGQMLCVFSVDVTHPTGRSGANCDIIFGAPAP